MTGLSRKDDLQRHPFAKFTLFFVSVFGVPFDELGKVSLCTFLLEGKLQRQALPSRQ